MRKCDNCQKREATSRWSGGYDAVNAFRNLGSLPWWCDVCATEAQLEHAKKQAERIPELENKLKESHEQPDTKVA